MVAKAHLRICMNKLDLKLNKRLFVTGTDTGVGKTVLSLLLMRYLIQMGEDPFYIKLIQTGCSGAQDTESDARFIYENIPQLSGKDPGESVPYCFENPKAPWFAARDEGKKIDLRAIVEAVEQKSDSHSVLVLEGAGGLFVPVDRTTLMIDLIGMLGARPILAARAGLGTINHTLLSISALRIRGLDPVGIIFLESPDATTQPEMIMENMEAIQKFSKIRVAGVIGKISDFSRISEEFYEPLREILG